MKFNYRIYIALAFTIEFSIIYLTGTAQAQKSNNTDVDWGGGYFTGSDSASTTVATSGAKPNSVVAQTIPSARTPSVSAGQKAPLTDWGGGYFTGPDSASATVATSGAKSKDRP